MQCLRVTARFRAPLRVRAAWVGRAGMASGARLSARTARQFVGTERLAQANIGAWRPQWSGRTYCTTSEGDISLAEYTKLIEDSLDSLMESFLDIEEAMEIEDFDCELADGVLRLCLGEHGTYVLNKQAPNKQLWLASPICGPKRYNWDQEKKEWVNTRDGHSLLRLLEAEIKELLGLELSLRIGN